MSEAHDREDKDGKTTTIIINGRPRDVEGKEISYSDVVKLAYDAPPTGNGTIYTVTFGKGEPPRHEGTLVAGQSVKVKKGMVFNVGITNKS